MEDASADKTDKTASWWGRPSGGREVLVVALPLVISALSWTVMTFADRVFLKWESGTAMAAAFSASTVWFSVVCFPLGVCTYANTFVSQYWGAEQKEKIGAATWHGVWTALIASPFILATIPLAPALFQFVGHAPEVVEKEIIYFQILCWGGPAMLISQALSSFYSGRGQTWVVMLVDAFYSVVNLVLDYFWIFGLAGFPAWGIAGAGWATVVSLWLKAITYALLCLQKKHQEVFGMRSGIALDWRLLKRLWYFGGPSGLQMLLDVLGFTVFILVVGGLGPLEAEATSMAFSISTLAFMPIWGLGLAVGILVGQRLGEDNPDLAARATWTSLVISMAYMAGISILYLTYPGLLLDSFFLGVEGTGVPETGIGGPVYNLAVNLLIFVAAYNLFDAAQMVFANAIKGAGDTIFILIVSLVMATLLGVLTWGGVKVFQLGVYGCWGLVTSWVCLMGVIFLVRFLQGKWRSMRVIEPKVV